MAYTSSIIQAKAKMFLVITSSLTNGPIVNFSSSFTVTGSYDPGFGSWTFGVAEQNIISINKLTYISSSLTGSDMQGVIDSTAQVAGFDIVNECNNMLTDFISSSNINSLFASKGVTFG